MTPDILHLQREIDAAHDKLMALCRDYCLVQREVHRSPAVIHSRIILENQMGVRPLIDITVDADGTRTEDDSDTARSGC